MRCPLWLRKGCGEPGMTPDTSGSAECKGRRMKRFLSLLPPRTASFFRVQSEVGLNKKESVNYHLSIVIWGLGRLALRSGTSPAPNAIRTAQAEGLQRPDDKWPLTIDKFFCRY